MPMDVVLVLPLVWVLCWVFNWKTQSENKQKVDSKIYAKHKMSWEWKMSTGKKEKRVCKMKGENKYTPNTNQTAQSF